MALKTLASASLALALGAMLAACGSTMEQRAATGGIAGAVVGGPVGAAVGATAGAAVEAASDARNQPPQ